MAVYEVAVQTTAAAAGAPFLAFQNLAPASGVRASIFEIGIATNAATLSALGLVRASATGTSSGTPPVGQPLDDRENQTSLCSLATAWSAAPTAGTIYLRQFQAAAVQGSGVIWTWPADAPLVVDAASQLQLWNFGVGAASALSVYFRWRE